MKHLLILFALALLTTLPRAAAQDLVLVEPTKTALPDPNDYPWSFYVFVPMPSLQFTRGYNNMESLLQQVDIEATRSFQNLVFGYGGRWKRLYLETWMSVPIFGTIDASDISGQGGVDLHSENYALALNLGVSVFQDRNHAIILRGGVGVLGREMQLLEVPSSTGFDFGNLATPPTTNARAWPSFSHLGEALDISVEWVRGRPKAGAHVAVSGRVGYMWGIGSRAWETDGTSVLNAPRDAGGMFYFTSAFSLSRNFKAKKKRR